MAPQQPIASGNQHPDKTVRGKRPANRRHRFARLSAAVFLLAALFLRASLGQVPTAYAASGFTVSVTNITTSEAGGTATFTIRLTGAPTANVTIGLTSSDTTEGTVSPASLTFTTANWNSVQTVTVTGVDDSVDDGTATYTIITAPAVSTDATYNNLNPPNVSATNTDNDTAGITVSGISGTTSETGGTATFTIVLNSQPTANVSISLINGDTTEGAISSTSLTFTAANWNIAQTVTVTGVNDNVDDGDIGYTIFTGNASSSDNDYDGINPSNVNVTNIDDDTAGATVTAISGNTSEASGTASFTIKLDSQPTASVTIGLTSNDTTEGTVSPASLTFTTANWNSAQTVTATGVDDALDDGDISYSIVTGNASSSDVKYNNLVVADRTLFNTDNDSAGFTISNISGNTSEAGGPATFTVKLNSQPTASVTIGLSSNDTTEGTVSPAALTFTTGNWNTAQTVTVTGVNDTVDDGDIGYTIVTGAASSTDPGYSGQNAADVAVINLDDDTAGFTVSSISGSTTEAGGSATFTIKLNSQPTADVTIGLSSSDTTEGSVSPSALTFTSGNWNVLQTVTVTGEDDAVVDGNIAYSIVTAPASSSDTTYDNLNPANVAVTNQDNDTAGITVSPTSGLITTESGGIASFTIKLESQPVADVLIALNSSDTTEGTLADSALTFTAANWNVAQTVNVTGANDAVDDGDIAYTIVTGAASSTDAIYNNRAVADVAATNQNNDTAGISASGISGNTTEAGGTATFTVVLTSQPTANVVIALSSNDTSEGTVSPAALTFTAANWDTAQTVTATGVNDAVDDGDIGYAIVIAAATSADAKYNGIDVADENLANIDDDGAGIIVSAISDSTSEATDQATFTVKLASQPTADVTIGLSSSDTTEGTISPSALVFTAANWNSLQTVTVTGVDDDVDDGDIAYTIIFAPATSGDPKYSALNAADVPATNLDDDTTGISVSTINGDTSETGDTASFTVVLDSQPTADVTIDLSSSDTTEGSVSPSALTFTAANWDSAQTVIASGVNDAVADGDRSYTIVTAPASSADINYDSQNAADVSVLNIDDDTAGITVSSISTDTTETGGTASFTVVLTSEPIADVVIAISSSNLAEGTISATSLTFTAADWSAAQSVNVTGVNDDVDDGNVTYTIITGAASSTDGNYSNRDAADVSVLNIDDDIAGITVSNISANTSEAGGTASFTVVLTSQPTADVTIGLSSSDTTEGTVSPAALTFTSANWSTPQSAIVAGVDDLIDDGDIAYTIETAGATSNDTIYNGMDAGDVSLSNIDNDGAGVTVSAISGATSEAGGTATFTVQLASQPTADVTIGLSSSDTTEGTVGPATLTFTAANWNVAQTVTVTGVNDPVDDGDIGYMVVLGASTSTDPAYNGQDAADIPAQNLDDDTAGISVTAISGNTSEAGGTATFSVVLTSQPSADATIGLSSSDTTEGTVGTATLTFTAATWNITQTVTVTGVNDDVDDNNVAYTIALAPATSADPQYALVKASDVSLSNLDDDTAGITVSPISGNTTEAGGSATFTVVLASQPTANVSIALTSDTTEGTVGPSVLTFTPADWNSPQTVTVTGEDDAVIDGNITYTIVTGDANSADPLYNGRQAGDVTVLNIDNEQANAGTLTVYLALIRR